MKSCRDLVRPAKAALAPCPGRAPQGLGKFSQATPIEASHWLYCFRLHLQTDVQSDRAMASGETVDTSVDGIPCYFLPL